MKRFVLDGRYKELLQAHGIDVAAVLNRARLPADALNYRNPKMTEEDYYRFIQAVADLSDDDMMSGNLARTDRIESFSPPIFASYCAKNGRACIERLARYKRLIGPVQFVVSKDDKITTVEIIGQNPALTLPAFLVAAEFAFLTNLIRRSTGENIDPVFAEMKRLPSGHKLAEFLNAAIVQGGRDAIRFRNADLARPFNSYDEGMWSYFEPELSKRLEELDIDDSVSARVRRALSELLPEGKCGIEDAAEMLGLPRRTLQRKLSEEKTTFQKQLNSVRETLAVHYIRNTEMTSIDIAFLLGYAELNSFLRAFSVWTGMSISEYKKFIK